MKEFFQSSDQFETLERSVPIPWEVIEQEDGSGVIVQFPIVVGFHEWEQVAINPRMAWYFHPHDEDRHLKVGLTSREQDDGSRRKNLEVKLDWPLPNDIAPRLTEAAWEIAGICLSRINQLATVDQRQLELRTLAF
jgi:hypothetical protein